MSSLFGLLRQCWWDNYYAGTVQRTKLHLPHTPGLSGTLEDGHIDAGLFQVCCSDNTTNACADNGDLRRGDRRHGTEEL